MKTSDLKYFILSAISNCSLLILAVLPFHAFLAVWLSTATGHYTAVRLWKEFLLVMLAVGAAFLVSTDTKIRQFTLSRRLVWLIQAYIVIIVARGLLGYAQGNVSQKALGYGLIVDLRFLVFFLIVWAVAVRTARLRINWQNIVIGPAIIVIAFGLLQAVVLPHDVLRHFGYGPNTIPFLETVNHNTSYVRITSTLRGANPLGAYLIIPICVMGVLLARASSRRNWQYALLVASYIALFFTFSRSAWLGAFAATMIVVATHIKAWAYRKQILYAAAGLIVIMLAFAVGFRNNSRFQNLVFHTENKSTIKTTSNHNHATALKDGLHDVIHRPLGDGIGTAGPASVYNAKQPARIAENYYIQIGQEAGWLGLALFSGITAGVGRLLWLRRNDSLALSLFAAFVGLCIVNMLSHAWADDTLAYVFWGLAGIAMVPDTIGKDTHES